MICFVHVCEPKYVHKCMCVGHGVCLNQASSHSMHQTEPLCGRHFYVLCVTAGYSFTLTWLNCTVHTHITAACKFSHGCSFPTDCVSKVNTYAVIVKLIRDGQYMWPQEAMWDIEIGPDIRLYLLPVCSRSLWSWPVSKAACRQVMVNCKMCQLYLCSVYLPWDITILHTYTLYTCFCICNKT